MREAEAHLRRAEEALQAAELAVRSGLLLDRTGRAYYAMFHAAHALLAARGISAKTHKGLIQQTREHVGAELGPELLRALASMQTLREDADYDVGFALSQREAQEAYDLAARFLARTQELLG